MLIKGSRCEVVLDQAKYSGLRFSTASEGRSEGGKDCQFIVPLVTNASGKSNHIPLDVAIGDFKKK